LHTFTAAYCGVARERRPPLRAKLKEKTCAGLRALRWLILIVPRLLSLLSRGAPRPAPGVLPPFQEAAHGIHYGQEHEEGHDSLAEWAGQYAQTLSSKCDVGSYGTSRSPEGGWWGQTGSPGTRGAGVPSPVSVLTPHPLCRTRSPGQKKHAFPSVSPAWMAVSIVTQPHRQRASIMPARAGAHKGADRELGGRDHSPGRRVWRATGEPDVLFHGY
jgi:hypothetical protein